MKRPHCEVCSRRPARIVLVRRKSGEDYQTFVCPDCADEKIRLYSNTALRLGELAGARRGTVEFNSSCCPTCGTVFGRPDASVAPGCCDCYLVFADVLKQAVRVVQGYGRHIGKTPDQ